MIPIRITIRNFMPYRDNVPTLDFTGIHTASICGDNGSGKSAIIDAITWALWGETRAKNKDDIINQNQPEAEVDFEFTVGEQRYRILRKHSRPKKRGTSGQSALHFQIASDDGFRPIDGDTMTQTQEKITGILHMDYNTFTNSAYLRQGHADEFTTASPAKRKEVLTKILDLTVYDNLESQAKEIARQRETEKSQLERSIADIDIELVQLPACAAELQKGQEDAASIDESVKGHEALLTALRQQKEALEAKNALLAQIEKSLQEKNRQLIEWQEQSNQLHARIKEHEELIARKTEIEAGYQQFVGARQQNETLNRDLTVFSRLNQKQHELEMAITRESQSLMQEHKLTQNKVAELEKSLAGLHDWTEQLKQSRLELGQVAGREELLKQQQQARQELLTQIGSLDTERQRLDREIKEIDEKLHLLRTQGGGTCPLCGSDIGEVGREHIEAQYNADRRKKADAVKAELAEIHLKQSDAKSLGEAIALEEKLVAQEKARLQSKIGAIEREIARAEESGKQLADQQAVLQQLEQRLNTRSFAAAQQEQLQRIETQLNELKYDPQEHENVRLLYGNMSQFEAPKIKLDEAEKLLKQETEVLNRVEKLALEAKQGLETDRANRQELSVAVAVLPGVIADVQQKESGLKSLMLQQKQAQEKVGNIRGRLDYLTQLDARRKEKANQLQVSAQEGKIYEDLAEAFGKKGVQALIIETALPEIENEANRLLARMTDGRMTVKIETQRETQKGDTVETLDIKISDELGTRNYEMFSGGEAFRINFAVRIALSRLLARRKGAPLPTLIVDEGFGTQDAGGIEKLREAITTIQDDFEKILVITHIDELRDAFPARIDVVKTVNGSMISLN